jgi:hypothetical protein
VQWTRFVDDANRSFVRANRDLRNIVEPAGELGMERHRTLDGSLRMKLGRERNLEQDVLHDVGPIRTLEEKPVLVERDVVEAPGPSRQYRRVAHLAGPRDQRQSRAAARCIAGGPTLARARVRGMPIRSQALAVDERVRDRCEGALPVEPEHSGDNRRRCDLDEQHVIKPDLVE